MAKHKVLILGIGNQLRRDDGIGPVVAQALIKIGTPLAIDCATAPENFLGTIKKLNPEKVIMVDACDFGAEPGAFRLFSLAELEKMPWATISTHTLPLSLVGNLIRQEAGCGVELLGVQPATVEFGEGLSESLRLAKRKILDFLKNLKPQMAPRNEADPDENKPQINTDRNR